MPYQSALDIQIDRVVEQVVAHIFQRQKHRVGKVAKRYVGGSTYMSLRASTRNSNRVQDSVTVHKKRSAIQYSGSSRVNSKKKHFDNNEVAS